MTELEIMQHAKTYLDKLAQGIDPISGQPVPPTDSLNNPRLSKCFQYVSGVLEKVIQNDGQINAPEKPSFTVTHEQLAGIRPTDTPIRIADFVDLILRTIGYEGMKKLSPTKLTNWLLNKGFLTQETGPDGKTHRVPTPIGTELGISVQMCQYNGSEYPGIFYNTNAQQFLLDNIPTIVGAGALS